MKIRFLGAAGNVTGSRFLLEGGGVKILVDCGLFQERDFLHRNWDDFPCPPGEIAAVILTHAHIDHCGYLPRLAGQGFRGPVFCTPPTAEIAGISLPDSGKIQEEDAAKKKLRHEQEGRRGPHPETPLYTARDAKKTLSLFRKRDYREAFDLPGGLTASFHDAGHILGAAMVKISTASGRSGKTLVFSGDIGRWNKPILRDPTVFEAADCVVMETTYGDRSHGRQAAAGKKLAEIISSTAEKNGNIVIPTFAVERAQELLYYLAEGLRKDRIPHLMTFVDSPMAINVTDVFRRNAAYFDDETRALMKSGRSPFDFPLLNMTRTVGESKAINHIKGSCVIMAGSGMCTSGRIKHHLAANIERPESTILFVGYQAKNTLGRHILGKPDTVRIHGRTYRLRARVEQISGFSAHADREDLLKWLGGFRRRPEKIFLAHGEESASAAFAGLLAQRMPEAETVIPEYLAGYEAWAPGPA